MSYAIANRHYAQSEGEIVKGGSMPETPYLATAQARLQARYEYYLARGYDVRWNAACDAFVAELHGVFHASYAIVEVQ